MAQECVCSEVQIWAVLCMCGRYTAREQQECLTFLVTKGVDDLDRLHLKGGAAVLAEHGADGVQHYLGFCQVSSSDLDEHILGIQADLHHTSNA